jgi:N6-L-threonylcarbamoyladenine synthase
MQEFHLRILMWFLLIFVGDSNGMKVLGIESSCDETAAAVVLDGQKILSNVVNSQIDIHAVYGGVFPK